MPKGESNPTFARLDPMTMTLNKHSQHWGLALHRQEYPGGPVRRGRHLAIVLPVVRRPRVLQSDNPVVRVWPVEGLEPLRTTRG